MTPQRFRFSCQRFAPKTLGNFLSIRGGFWGPGTCVLLPACCLLRPRAQHPFQAKKIGREDMPTHARIVQAKFWTRNIEGFIFFCVKEATAIT